MAITATISMHSKWFRHRANVYNVTLDNSYPTGGYAVTPNQFMLNSSKVDEIIVGQAWSSSLGKAIIVAFDKTNQKLVAYWSAASGAVFGEVTNGTDLSTYEVKLIALGR